MSYRRSKIKGILVALLFSACMLATGFIWGRISAPMKHCEPPVRRSIIWTPKQQKLWITYYKSKAISAPPLDASKGDDT
jgi:hypothetical protein